MKNKVVELALNLDPLLIRHLLKSESMKSHFFSDVDGIFVFDKIKFQKFVSNKKFLPDSFTSYKNKIGLTSESEYLTDSQEVVLSWPYKDCVLEGGQDREDSVRTEIFWNETLAPDQIDRLLSPKALANFRYLGKKYGEYVEEVSAESHLLIKGNNLLSLHTLVKNYEGKVRLIYIDPPYNTNNDSFQYNDSFSHSTWLTFMRSRLEVAKKLLAPNGVIAMSIDQNEAFYLKVLGDEVFGRANFISAVTVQNNPKGRVMDRHFATSHEYILFYSKARLAEELSVRKTAEQLKKDYTEQDEDGSFRTLELRNTHREFGKHNRENLFYPIYVNPADSTVSLEKSKEYHIKVEPIWDDGFEGCWTWGTTKVELEGDLLLGRQVKGQWKIYRKSYATSDDGEAVSRKLKTIWLAKEFHTEKGQKAVDQLVGKGRFRSPKPVEMIKTIVDLATKQDSNDIVMDFFAGSGTTGQAVLELNAADSGNRVCILCEQLDYIETTTSTRLQKVAEPLGQSIIYCELAVANQAFVDAIEAAATIEDLAKIWADMQEKAFLSYRVNPRAIDESRDEFANLSLADQKRFLVEVLDKNMLYVPASEIDDQAYAIPEADKAVNKKFFG
ncbi:hypothetical protein CT3_08920 [Comamonas terrigena NBRC 13299]|nr:hypothetical protein CT3_08920 [Comamonas terrigena NBRC 13299]